MHAFDAFLLFLFPFTMSGILSLREPKSREKVEEPESETLTGQHVRVCTITDGEDVRWDFCSSFSFVQIDDSRCVDRVSFVRIDGDTEKS